MRLPDSEPPTGVTSPTGAQDRRHRPPDRVGRAARRTERTTTTVTLDLTAGRPDIAGGPLGTGGDAAARRHPAVGPAVARDLDRLVEVLAEPVTAVRRAALVAHITFLVEQARSGGDGPGRYPVALSRLGHEARAWARDPLRRPQVRAAAQAAAPAWAASRSGFGPEPAAETGARSGSGPRPDRVSLRSLPGRRPTALAYRYFWLLDNLAPDRVPAVTEPYSGPARWVLRNVLSGGYNRRAYLMWFGGGSGPTV